MKQDFVSKGRSVSDLKVHIVLVTKYRRHVFTSKIITRLGDVLEDLCKQWDCKLIEFNGEEDHVHILIQYYPQMSLPKFVNNIKTVSSRKLRSEFADHVDEIYWKDVLWSSSYFVASCGGVTVSILKQYIEKQKKPE